MHIYIYTYYVIVLSSCDAHGQAVTSIHAYKCVETHLYIYMYTYVYKNIYIYIFTYICRKCAPHLGFGFGEDFESGGFALEGPEPLVGHCRE